MKHFNQKKYLMKVIFVEDNSMKKVPPLLN